MTAYAIRSRVLTISLLITLSLGAQLPPSQKLPPEEERGFNAELERLRALLPAANDKCAVQLQIANTYAAGGQYAEAIQRLRKLIDADLGFDPSRDPDFAPLRNTTEFQSILRTAGRQTPPVCNSRLITIIDERNLFPENIAFDPAGNAFFLGSTANDTIVRCSMNGACVPAVKGDSGGNAYTLGLKVDKLSRNLWATHNAPNGASLIRHDIETGKLEQTARLDGKHVFNDLALSSAGFVYVTDTSEGSVYQLNIRTNTLKKMSPQHKFTAANGIAISPDQKLLYVSAWGEGIDVIDIDSESITPILHPENVCLAFIDGLYATTNSLIAFQNGPMLPRIVQFRLTNSGREIANMRVLERRNPSFDGITTGVLVGGELCYVANPQIDKKNSAKLNPLQIFAVRVLP